MYTTHTGQEGSINEIFSHLSLQAKKLIVHYVHNTYWSRKQY